MEFHCTNCGQAFTAGVQAYVACRPANAAARMPRYYCIYIWDRWHEGWVRMHLGRITPSEYVELVNTYGE